MKRDVIIALDFKDGETALNFLDKFQEEKPFVKVGMELFFAEGPSIVKEIKRRGHKIFLDLKLHDIPNTVKGGMRSLTNLGADILNVHAAGTIEMMKAALEGTQRPDGTAPMLIAVTQLTSTSEERMQKDLLINATINDTILHYAKNAKEAAQWLYFGYLAAIKTQNGAAMSVGRISTFLDIYIDRDLKNGTLTEKEAQELIDHLVMKFRMVKFARPESYNQLFSGDPVWATLEVAGLGMDGRSMVTKSDYRFLHTLVNMGPSPEPNLTVLYSSHLPENFKKFAAYISVKTSSIQYENDDVMRPVWGDDYSICCCVSATQTGKEIQFFGARANLAKCLLYAINGGVDEKTGEQVGPKYQPITSEYLDYDEVIEKYDAMMDWLAHLYVGTLNMIHYMHDKYYYEAAEMALIDTDVRRTFATGIAGFSHVVDSLSAIKYAKVKTIRDENGKVVDYETIGDFPKYGNDDDRADEIAVKILSVFMDKLKYCHTYRDSEPTTSILTITSNVVYGKATGSLPDGRKAGEPLSPGANPSYGAEKNGLLASLNSVAKLPYELALDGISNTQTINPGALGHDDEERVTNLTHVLDGYFNQGAHHLNVNVFGTEKLIDAMEHPEKPEYANFTIRVSGYAVKFIDLTREQQLDVIARTCHDRM